MSHRQSWFPEGMHALLKVYDTACGYGVIMHLYLIRTIPYTGKKDLFASEIASCP